MSAYNKVNGAHCAENAPLLRDVLQQEFGFKGFVISDWGSTYSTAAHRQCRHGSGDARRRSRMKHWMARPETAKSTATATSG